MFFNRFYVFFTLHFSKQVLKQTMWRKMFYRNVAENMGFYYKNKLVNQKILKLMSEVGYRRLNGRYVIPRSWVNHHAAMKKLSELTWKIYKLDTTEMKALLKRRLRKDMDDRRDDLENYLFRVFCRIAGSDFPKKAATLQRMNESAMSSF